MSFVAVVTVSICIRHDCFVRTVTVWVVGIPTLSSTFDTCTNRLPSVAKRWCLWRVPW